jgi:hypothetical protein
MRVNMYRASGRTFGELLQHFLLERFLDRLGQPQYRERFVLKGAIGPVLAPPAVRVFRLYGDPPLTGVELGRWRCGAVRR